MTSPTIKGMIIMLVVTTLFAGTAPADAASTPGWAINALTMPTDFSSGDNTLCNANERCDKYSIVVTNVGATASTAPVIIKDTLPGAGVSLFNIRARDLSTTSTIPCTAVGMSIECVDNEPIAVAASVLVDVRVLTEAGPEMELEDRVEVQGGGAANPVSSHLRNTSNGGGTQEFGVADFGVLAAGEEGMPEEQAGARPRLITSSFDLVNVFAPGTSSSSYLPVEEPKSITVELPLGLIGNPEATEAKCQEADLAAKPPGAKPGFTSSCPAQSRIGTVVLKRESNIESSQASGSVSALYNMEPEKGYPAVFGFRFISAPVLLYTRVVPTPEGYRFRITAANIPHANGTYKVIGSSLSFFGVPNVANKLVGAEPKAFFRNPTSCANKPEDLNARLEVSSWVKPSRVVVAETPVYSAITGCNLLQFDPELQVDAQMTQSDTPSGYEVKLKVPQPQLFEETATPDLKYASMTLPQGTVLSPGGAGGLEGCTEAEIDPMGTELGEGHVGGNGSPYDDGLEHASAGHCPEASKVGKVEIKTPLLPEPLKGSVYVAQPTCGGDEQPECTEASASNGELYGMYLEISGSGMILKLHGKVSVNPSTGQITTSVSENPQLPFEELKLTLDDGERAPLANPQTCGTATAIGELEPWSAPESGPNATTSSSFAIGGCSKPMGFAPGLAAGATSPVAHRFSPFTMTLTRKDGEQNLAGVSLTLPAGVSATVANVPQCEESQARLGSCPEASRIGTANVAAGAGTEPLWLSGPVYFTGPYKGAPFGLSIVVPAKAGPFDLGNVIERAAIRIDPKTGQVTVTGDPLPQIRDGVQLRLKTVNVVVDRPNFLFNPTNCTQQRVNGSVSGELPDGSVGATVAVSSPFAVVGCKTLPFKPSFSVFTTAKHSKKNGAFLHVRVKTAPGEANVGSVKVDLPRQLPARLSTLNLACTEGVFDENPAACPEASRVGTVRALTPILAVPLTGPAYFVSHGGAKFPELVIVLQGDGVTLQLDGETFVSPNGITSSTFPAIPDVPVRRFDLVLPTGPHSVLGGNGNFCATPLKMPTRIKGQNGVLVEQGTKVKVTGCKPTVTVVRKKVKGASATIVANVPMAGKLVASGDGLLRGSKTLSKAGNATVSVSLSKAERRFLSHHPGRRLKARVRLRFMPRHGKPLSTAVTLLLG
jgi:hypothetical protein